ncbi:hypothetical protein PV726_32850 [Streptomyces europaeiscabiei]|uniref:hypothetical protein n=1 Tax=Streptomyces europaeiscabiei TaxID=146819 RepID=UPI0029BF0C18|nr:hypothetical protein [Streptomyces europaeiscabiei]MDX3695046.1 hypothetical protein [Streptomyces europaeiscabiei]
MPDATTRPEPRGTAFLLIRMTARGEAAHRAQGEQASPPADFEMYRALTAALQAWHTAGTLREDSLLLTEWLATEWCGYRLQQLGQDQDRFDHWLRDFGDQVCAQQRHAHPAGPTAMEITSVIAARSQTTAADHLTRLAVAYLGYLRPGHEVQDAREIALTFALWAGEALSALMHHDTERISGYTAARTP